MVNTIHIWLTTGYLWQQDRVCGIDLRSISQTIDVSICLTVVKLYETTPVSMGICSGTHLDYLLVLSIAVCFKAFGGVQLDGGAADHLDATLLALRTQRSYATVHLRKTKSQEATSQTVA